MPYSDPEQERAYQAKYRKANAEARKAYDRERYMNVRKLERQIARDGELTMAKDHRPKKRSV